MRTSTDFRGREGNWPDPCSIGRDLFFRTIIAKSLWATVALFGGLTVSGRCRAEGLQRTGVAAIGTGFQGGDVGNGAVGWMRARTRFMGGVDLRNDESLTDSMGFYGFVELERRTTLGAEVRYQHWWTPTVGFHVGGIGVITPESMFGISAGARFGLPLGKRATLFLEPAFAAFPVGTDLPTNSVVVWGILNGGIGVTL